MKLHIAEGIILEKVHKNQSLRQNKQSFFGYFFSKKVTPARRGLKKDLSDIVLTGQTTKNTATRQSDGCLWRDYAVVFSKQAFACCFGI